MNRSTFARHFTLVEILVVITLAALALGTLGIRGLSALRQHQFEASVDQIVSKLNLAQHLMLCCRADVVVQIERDTKDRLILQIRGDEALPDNFKMVTSSATLLKGIEALQFDGAKKPSLSLCFHRQAGLSLPRGTLTLTSTTHRTVYIPLPGHFAKITKSYDEPAAVAPPLSAA